ncbi:MAG: TonB-dependent receptor [Acidobacteria bacterium]|nr:TonB-dependent receptor [Acidobacteriota bacterium]
MGRTTILFVCLVLAFVLIWHPLYGQTRTAAISGTVNDSTGAILPGVTVAIHNVDTGLIREVVTDDQGRYRAPELAVGNYEVRAELAGFQTAVHKGIELAVGTEVIVNFALQIGEISEEVVVTGEAPLVNTTTATLSELVDQKQVHDLPLNARDLTQLSLLTPGVSYARTAPSGTQYSGTATVKISVGGARVMMTGFLLDGVDITDSSRSKSVAGAAGSLFGVETVREFQVLTNNYSAQLGRFAGGVVSLVTKSGTNEFHGSIFEFLRNDNLDARNFFDPKVPPEFKRNQFGFTVGGPIKKDRTFFFGSYEGFRESLGLTFRPVVPTADVRRGLLPDGRTVTLNPSVKPFLDLYPLPSAGGRVFSGGGAEYIVAKTQPTGDDFWTGKLDHTFSEADTFMMRYTVDVSDVTRAGNGLPGTGWVSDSGNHYGTLEEKHIFSPHLIMTARFGFSRNRWSQLPPPDSPPLSISLIPDQPMGTINPGSGVSSVGIMVVGQNTTNAYQYVDDVFITHGRHDLKTGIGVTRYQNNDFFDFQFQGVYTFSTVERFITGQPNTYTGNAPGSDTHRGARQTVIGMYVQDDIKIVPNFALNLGLRYEFSTTPFEVNGKMVNLRDPLHEADTTKGFPFFNNPSKKNFAPRIGFAWDPFKDGKTSVRGGFGVFDDIILFYHFGYPMRDQAPLRTTINIDNPTFPLPTLTNVRTARAIRPLEFEPSQPYMMQWNLTLQREAPGSTTFTVAYVGSRGVHLSGNHNLNVAVPEILPDGRKFFAAGLRRRNPNWDDLWYYDYGYNSAYHGLQLGARKRFGSGLQFQGSYTWSRCIDEGSQYIGGDYSGQGYEAQDPYDVKGSNRGLCNHHISNNFSLNYVYALPINGLSGIAQKLLQGWELGGILSLSDGPPMQVALGSLIDWNRDLNRSNERPNVRSGASNSPVLSGGRNPDLYFDPKAFELPSAGFYGNLGRNTLYGPGVAVFDFSLMKNTSVRENKTLQFRAEFFNILNRANFGIPALSIFANSSGGLVNGVGSINSTTTTSRQIQFGLKFLF